MTLCEKDKDLCTVDNKVLQHYNLLSPFALGIQLGGVELPPSGVRAD